MVASRVLDAFASNTFDSKEGTNSRPDAQLYESNGISLRMLGLGAKRSCPNRASI
jgi:hypothetical protein